MAVSRGVRFTWVLVGSVFTVGTLVLALSPATVSSGHQTGRQTGRPRSATWSWISRWSPPPALMT